MFSRNLTDSCKPTLYLVLFLLFTNTLVSQTIKIQAESGVFTGNARITDIYPGFEGEGFVGYLTKPGSAIKLKANVTDGTYKLNLRYSAGVNSGYTIRTVTLKINGVYKRKISFSQTGTWSQWSTSSIVLDLPSGNNDIELIQESDDTGYINLDYIELTLLDSSSPSFGRIQAESGSFTGNARITDIHSGFDGASFVGYLTKIGSGVTIETNANEGDYDLNIRYSAGSTSTDRTVTLKVNGIDSGTLSMLPTGSWNNWSTYYTTVALASGTNTIEIIQESGDTGYINLDYFELAPLGSGSDLATSSRLQAESGSFTGDVRTTDIHPGFDGNAFIGYLTKTGSGITVRPNISAGSYDLNIRYAAGLGSVNRTVTLKINGIDTGTLSMPPTDSWSSWRTYSTTVELSSGSNTIEIIQESNDTGFVNLDHFELRPLGFGSGEATSARIQAESGTFTGNTRITDVHQGYDGRNFIGYFTSGGSGVTLKPNMKAGTYDLNLRYSAAPKSGFQNRTATLNVNGVVVETLSFTPTESWNEWSTISTPVVLLGGTNTVEVIQNTADTGYINLDYLDFGIKAPKSLVKAPVASDYLLKLSTFATHTEFQGGEGSNPLGTASAFGAIDIGAPKDNSGRVFMSSQTGKILVYDQSGNPLGEFLDMNAVAIPSGFINGDGASAFRGLMYFDFHPDFNDSNSLGYNKVYVVYQIDHKFDNNGKNADYRIQDYHSRTGRNQYAIAEFTVSNDDSNKVDSTTFREVFRVQMEGNNPHGIGEIAFNPMATKSDDDYGLLYMAIGDGNARGNNAPDSGYLQNLNNPYGKILRVNPLKNETASYSIPATNPYATISGFAQEIYAIGFRDPQTFSFAKDAQGKSILITFEIGAKQREEVIFVRPGGNYGWEKFEGSRINNTDEELVSDTDHSLPVIEYDHATGFAVIGGLLVSEPNNPDFQNKVIFSDLPTGKVFYADFQEMLNAESSEDSANFYEINNFEKNNVTVTEITGNGNLSFEDVINKNRGDLRFGYDERGDVYFITKQNGEIYKTELIHNPLNSFNLTATKNLTASESLITNEKFDFKIYPNPASKKIFFDFKESNDTTLNILIYDNTGRLILSKVISSTNSSVDINQLTTGIYYVSCYSNNERVTKKVVIIGRD